MQSAYNQLKKISQLPFALGNRTEEPQPDKEIPDSKVHIDSTSDSVFETASETEEEIQDGQTSRTPRRSNRNKNLRHSNLNEHKIGPKITKNPRIRK